MKKIILIILILCFGRICFAQTPVSTVQLTTNTPYIEPGTGLHWYYNGIHYLWSSYYTKHQVDSVASSLVSGVSSVFGRTGAVTAQSGDYASFYLGINATAQNSFKWNSQSLNISGLANGDYIKYNSGSGAWENTPFPSALPTPNPLTLGYGFTGQPLSFNGSSAVTVVIDTTTLRTVANSMSLAQLQTNYTRKFWVDVKRDFGAKGDGSHDDSPNIQAALNYAAAHNMSVYFPATPNFYRVTKQGETIGQKYIFIVPSNTKIVGDGKASKIHPDNDSCSVFLAYNVNNVSIDGINVTGNKITKYAPADLGIHGSAVYYQSVTNVSVTNSWFYNNQATIFGQATETDHSQYFNFFGNHFTNNGGSIMITGDPNSADTLQAMNVKVLNNFLDTCGATTGIVVQYGIKNISITGNVLVGGSESGILADGVQDASITGNSVKDFRNFGIVAAQTSAKLGAKNIAIVGNSTVMNGGLPGSESLYGNIGATFLDDKSRGILISSNVASHGYSNGIALLPVPTATSPLSDIKISNNLVDSNKYDGISLLYQNSQGSNRIEISGNRASHNEHYGITEYAGDNNQIINNIVFGNGYDGIQETLSSNNTISNNIVFDNDYQNTSSYSGINIFLGSNNLLANNNCYNTSAGTKQSYGINISNSGSAGTILKGNILIGNKVSGYNDVGTNTLFYFNNTDSGLEIGTLATGSPSADDILVSHGGVTGSIGSFNSLGDARYLLQSGGDISGLVTSTRAVGTGYVAANANMVFKDNTSQAAGVGGLLVLSGAYDNTTTTEAAAIKALKSNSTNGDYKFDLGFATRDGAGGVPIERMRITYDGLVNIPGLSASQLVATDASKNLVSITALPSGTTATTQSAGTNDNTVATSAALYNAVGAQVFRGAGQATLVGGTVTISLSGVTTSSVVLVGLSNPAGTRTNTWQYQATPSPGSIAITAVSSAGVTNTLDTSTLSYYVIN